MLSDIKYTVREYCPDEVRRTEKVLPFGELKDLIDAIEPEDLAAIIADWVNGMHGSPKEAVRFADALCNEHRYLQRNVIDFMIRSLMGMAEAAFDGRNAIQVEFCKNLRRMMQGGAFGLAWQDLRSITWQ